MPIASSALQVVVKRRVLLASFILIALVLFLALWWLHVQSSSFFPQRIAHAGGSFSGIRITNSIEALNASYAKGFRYFEIDISYTSDHHLVCSHGWHGKRAKAIWGEGVPSLEEFFKPFVAKPYKPCTLESLMQWLGRREDAVLVTDIKQQELDVLRAMANEFPQLRRRIIPQIYQPENFDDARALGYHRVIWTLYRYDGANQRVAEEVGKFTQPFALAFDIDRLNSNLLRDLRAQKHTELTVYVHTINDKGLLCLLKGAYSISEVFTDVLAPSVNCDI